MERGPSSGRCTLITRTAWLVTLIGIQMLWGQRSRQTGTTTLSITVGAEASILVTNSTTTLTGTVSANQTGTTNLLYKTGGGSGTGAVTVQVTRELPSGGIDTPTASADTLAYVCNVVASSLRCWGAQTASTTVATPVASFGAETKPGRTNATSLAWMLSNDESSTSDYRAIATFTISAV